MARRCRRLVALAVLVGFVSFVYVATTHVSAASEADSGRLACSLQSLDSIIEEIDSPLDPIESDDKSSPSALARHCTDMLCIGCVAVSSWSEASLGFAECTVCGRPRGPPAVV